MQKPQLAKKYGNHGNQSRESLAFCDSEQGYFGNQSQSLVYIK